MQRLNPAELHRLDPARNMFRFYRLAIEPDLFGGVRLLRQWGRIAARGPRARPRKIDKEMLFSSANSNRSLDVRKKRSAPKTNQGVIS